MSIYLAANDRLHTNDEGRQHHYAHHILLVICETVADAEDVAAVLKGEEGIGGVRIGLDHPILASTDRSGNINYMEYYPDNYMKYICERRAALEEMHALENKRREHGQRKENGRWRI